MSLLAGQYLLVISQNYTVELQKLGDRNRSEDHKVSILVWTLGILKSLALLMYLPCGLLPYGQIMGCMVGATESHYLGDEGRS